MYICTCHCCGRQEGVRGGLDGIERREDCRNDLPSSPRTGSGRRLLPTVTHVMGITLPHTNRLLYWSLEERLGFALSQSHPRQTSWYIRESFPFLPAALKPQLAPFPKKYWLPKSQRSLPYPEPDTLAAAARRLQGWSHRAAPASLHN